MKLVIYLVLMAGVTYLIRAIPFTLCTAKITNRFVRSFLYYIPYAVLSAMTFPAIFYSTGNILTAALGTVTALVLAFLGLPLTAVSMSAAAVVLVSSFFL